MQSGHRMRVTDKNHGLVSLGVMTTRNWWGRKDTLIHSRKKTIVSIARG